MGARQSKRSVDITTSPKKGEDGSVAIGEGEGKLEKIAEIDAKVTTNGTVHSEIEYADKDESANDENETSEIKENGVTEAEDESTKPAEVDDESSSNEAAAAAGDKLNDSTTSPSNEETKTEENKKTKEKSKKKKWSFRSISFSKKDKSKPSKDSEKNGDVKEVVEENMEASPSEETAKIEEEVKTSEEASSVQEAAPEVEITKEEPKAVVAEEIKPIAEEPPKAVEEPVTESKPVEVETKEVGNTEEIPPPLPTTNPPNPVTVFAESTKADILSIVQTEERPSTPPTVETKPIDTSTPVLESVNKPEVIECTKPIETCPIVCPIAVETPIPVEESPKPETPVANEAPVVNESPISVEVCSKPESPVAIDLPTPPADEPKVVEETEAPIETSQTCPLPSSEITPIQTKPEEIAAATIESSDSLPDISTTESLPSLPEPLSESLAAEPMSLPPVDSLPEPIAPPSPTEASSSSPIKTTEIKLTNGNTNGLPASPISNNDDAATLPPPVEGPLKQVPPVDGGAESTTVEKVAETAPAVEAAAATTAEE